MISFWYEKLFVGPDNNIFDSISGLKFSKINLTFDIYGLKHLFKDSITTEFIFSTFLTNDDEPFPNFPHCSINILSKSFPIPIAWIRYLSEFSVINL